MTPEQFAEIKARHADDARTHANTGQVSNGFADRAALIAEVERLRALPTWQPIETAPKDGTRILLASSKKSRVADGFWKQGHWVWPYILLEPARWMPLPA